jgi:hypothetical protein
MDQLQRRRSARMTCAFGYLTTSPADGHLDRREAEPTEGGRPVPAEGPVEPQRHAPSSMPPVVRVDTAGSRRATSGVAEVSVTRKRARRVPVDVE